MYRTHLFRRPASRCVPEALESRTLFAAGDLDTSFGGDGVVTLDDVAGVFNDVATLPGGKLLAVGSADGAAGNRDVFLARFNADGSPDTTFGGGDGRVFQDFGTAGDNALRVAVRPDGKVLTYGNVLARFHPNGTLDTTFGGGDGFVAFPPPPQFGASQQGFTLQSDNKIVVARYDRILRFTADGAPDASFGDGGAFVPSALTRPSGSVVFNTFFPVDVAAQSDNRIVVAGQGYINDEEGPDYGHAQDFIVLRLTASGQLDNTFANGDEGGDFFAWGNQDGDDEVNRMALAPDGRIAITGTEDDEEAHHLFLDRNGDGLIVTNYHWGYGTARDVAFDANGETQSAGYQRVRYDEAFEKAVRSTGAGRVDLAIDLDDEALGIAVEADNDVVLVGYVSGPLRPFILRYEGEPSVAILLNDGVLSVRGGPGDDVISIEATATSVTARVNGQSRTFARAAVTSVGASGYDGNDTLTLSGMNGSLVGGAGDDTLRAVGGAGGALQGGYGNDRIYAGDGRTTLGGGGGNDLLVGGRANDTLNGDDGNDTLDGGLGADELNGGDGIDVADYSSRTAALTITLGDVAGDGAVGEGDYVAPGVERVRGGSGNDRISGSALGGVVFWGNGGNDTLTGGSAADALWGGGGNDVLDGAAGNDHLDGAAGNDTLRGGEGDDTLDDASGTNSLDGGPGADTINGVPESTGQNITLQAEDAAVVGAARASDLRGYTGSGYVDYAHASGDSVTWTFNVSAAGTRQLEFRYSNGSTSTRALQLTVNGTVVASRLNFAPTGSWSTWRTVSISVPLAAGQNTVRLATNGVQGPNLDSMDVRGGTVTPPPTSLTLQGEQATLSGVRVSNSNAGYTGTGYADYPDTTGSYVQWSFDNAAAGRRTLSIRYANGGGSDRPLELRVNGAVVAPRLALAPTGSWSTWRVINVTADLVAGANTVRLSSVAGSGPNVDSLSVQ